MQDQRIITPSFISCATPTGKEIALFEKLTVNERKALLRNEIEQGFSGVVSEKSFDAIVADVRKRARGTVNV